jgi:putative transposase
MSNHFHIVGEPRDIDTLSRCLHRVLHGYALSYHRRHGTTGHLWQGRYKSFPIEADEHYLSVIRYVLRNPVRARIVERVRDYPWTSLHHANLIDEWPLPGPQDREHWLSEGQSTGTLIALRRSINGQLPFGSPEWTAETAQQLGIRLRRRPKMGTGTLSQP